MGNQSEKKIAQYRQKVIGLYLYPTLILSIIFLIYNAYDGYLFTFSGFLLISIIQIAQWFCFTRIDKSLQLGLDQNSYSIFIDILALNGFVELFSIFFDWAWHIYWFIPLILLYKFGGVIWGWLQNNQYVSDEKDDKKKKKDKKEKVKYIK
ncbi:hypothetical protein pb186bvf_008854 [Paramecium bursaria]